VSGADLTALLPMIVVAAASVLAMVVIAIRRSLAATLLITVAGLGGAFAALWPAAAVAPRQVTPLLVIDRYAIFYMGLILAATLAVALLSYGYFQRCEGQQEELFVLLLLATLGSVVLVASTHFASFFLGLEILSVSLYALAAYLRTRSRPLEAGMKYLVLAASSAAFLVFGMALIYAELGTMSFSEIARKLAAGTGFSLPVVLFGTAFLLTGIGFKLAVVPFHLWTPDVYQGAPAPVTAFVATVSKGSMFALLVRYFYQFGWQQQMPAIYLLFFILAVASMIAGNLLALLQSNVKRILAYSSIAHLGYLLVAFLAGGAFAIQAITFYLVAYFVTMLGAFGVVTVLSDGAGEAEELSDYQGLFWRRPVLAAIFTLMLLSLAGIPVTAGFLGKFYIIAAGASASRWALILILVITSVIGLYYYLRIVVTLYSGLSASAEAPPATVRLPLLGTYTLAALAILLLWFGVYPSPLLNLIQTLASGFLGH
jgi:NADH-quinone oxidoreductase subunit N